MLALWGEKQSTIYQNTTETLNHIKSHIEARLAVRKQDASSLSQEAGAFNLFLHGPGAPH